MRNRSMTGAIALVGMLASLSISLTRITPLPAAEKAQSAGHLPDLSGVWLGRGIQTYNPDDPMGKTLEDGTPYQPWALAKLKSQRPGAGPNGTFEDTTDPALKYSDPDGYPRALLHPFKIKIVQTPDFVYFLFQYNQYWRPIAMNREHPKDPDPTWWGDSIGRYDGDTLVVDSVGFNDKTWLDPVGRPHTEALHIVERFRRVDHETLEDDLTFDDPGAYVRPWTGKVVFKLDPVGKMVEMVYTMSDEIHFQNDIMKPSSQKPSRK
jgi:hypothetical protein